MPLTALAIKNAKPSDKPRKLADEKGLFLLINPNGSKYWRLKYRIDGKEKLLAIGVYCGPTQYDDSGKAKTDKIQLSLTEARDLAYEARKQIKDGIDPNQAKQQEKQQAIFDAENCFEAVAREWHTRSATRWSTDHAARILRRIEVELFPTLGKRSVNELKTRDLLMSENTINKALRLIGYDTEQDICGHGFRAMACSALNESGLWAQDIIERQMSHQERNGVRAAYIHKAEYLTQRSQMMQWWADFLDAQRGGEYVEAVEFAGHNNLPGTPLLSTCDYR